MRQYLGVLRVARLSRLSSIIHKEAQMSNYDEAKHLALRNKWLDIIHECRNSGEEVQSWCKNHSISVKSFYRWQRMIRKEAFDLLPEVTKLKMLSQNKQPVLEDSHFVRIPNIPNRRNADTGITIQMEGIKLSNINSTSYDMIKHTLQVFGLSSKGDFYT